MISTRHRFIFVHIPKTGGNSVQECLLPLSEDTKVLSGHQDGQDRYEISGPLTRTKHADLQSYHQALHTTRSPDGQAGLDGFAILTTIRHPFERAVAHYFSPGRWFRAQPDGTWRTEPAHWDEAAFWTMIERGQHRPAVDQLRVNGTPRRPDHVMRLSHLAQDFRACVTALALPLPAGDLLAHRNPSRAPDALRHRVLGSIALRDAVEARFAQDMAFFDFGSYTLAMP